MTIEAIKPLPFSILRPSSSASSDLSISESTTSVAPSPRIPKQNISPDLKELLIAMQTYKPVSNHTSSHTLAAHFLGSHFIKNMTVGAEHLEGEFLSSITSYMMHLLDQASREGGLAAEESVQAYRQNLKQILEVEHVAKEMMRLFPQLPIQKEGDPLAGQKAIWQKRAHLFSEWMCHRISTLKRGECWVIPGGWKGHTMLYEIKRTSDELFEMRIFNTGGGLEYHPQLEQLHNTQSIQILKASASDQRLLSLTLWQNYYEMRYASYPGKEEIPHNQFLLRDYGSRIRAFGAEDVYAWLETIDPSLICNHMVTQNADAFRRPQTVGICSVEALFLLAKWRLGNKQKGKVDCYHLLRTPIRYLALQEYDTYLTTSDLLPKDLSSPARRFDSNQEIFKQRGVLQLLYKETNQLRRELLRCMRKNYLSRSFIERLADDLQNLQHRIEKRKKECYASLKERSHLELNHERDLTIAIPPPLHSVSQIRSIKKTIKHPEQAVIPVWPQLSKDVGLFLKQFEENRPSFNEVVWLYLTMPAVHSKYWDGMAIKDAQEALRGFVSIYPLQLQDNFSKGKHANYHYFLLIKVLSVLLKLSETDPVMKEYHFPYRYEELFGLDHNPDASHLPGKLFTTDSVSHLEIESTQDYLKNYMTSRPWNPSVTSSEAAALTYEISFDWSDSKELSHLWKTMNPSAKEAIIYDETREGGARPSDALILALAMCSSEERTAPSIGFLAVHQQMLMMRQLWYVNSDRQEKRNCTLTIRPHCLIQWRKTHSEGTNFILHEDGDFDFNEAFYTFIEKEQFYLTRDQEQGSWFHRSKTEKEMMEYINQFQVDDKEHAIFSRSLQCQEDRYHQIQKAIIFYAQHMYLLSNDMEQVRLTALLLEPGLLGETLMRNPSIWGQLSQFLRTLTSFFAQDRQTHLFCLRLSSQVEAFVSKKGIRVEKGKDLPHLMQELRILWQKVDDLAPEEQHLARYAISIEALAHLGQRGEIESSYLEDLVRYHLFFSESGKGLKTAFPLHREIFFGQMALILFIQECDPEAVSEALAQILGRPKSRWTLQAPKDKQKMKREYLLTSEDGIYSIDLFSGQVLIDGQPRVPTLPCEITYHYLFKEFFASKKGLSDIRIQYGEGENILAECNCEGVAYSIRYSNGLLYILREDASKHCYYHYIQRIAIPLGIQKSIPHSTPWYDEVSGIIYFIDSADQVTHIYNQKLLEEVGTKYIAADMSQSLGFTHFVKNVDEHAQIWRDPTTLQIMRIDLPTHKLKIKRNNGYLEGSGRLSGFYLDDDQFVRALAGFLGGYVVFKHPITQEKRVLLPIRHIKGNRDYEKALDYDKYIWEKKTYALFTIQKNGSLYSDSIKDNLYLTYCYLHLDKPFQASLLLQTRARKLTGYDKDELFLLGRIIINLKEERSIYDSRHALVYLRSVVLFLENSHLVPESTKLKEGQPIKSHIESSLKKEYHRYVEQREMIPPAFLLTKREEALLERAVKSKSNPFENQRAFFTGVQGPRQITVSKLIEPNKTSLIPTITSADIVKWKKSQTLFISQTPPLGFDRMWWKGDFLFLDLYAIARSHDQDPISMQQRQELALWLSCARGQEHECANDIHFLRAVINMPREMTEHLPPPEEVIDALNSKQVPRMLIEQVIIKQVGLYQPKQRLLPVAHALPKVKPSLCPKPLAFEAIKPLNGVEKEASLTPLLASFTEAGSPKVDHALRIDPLDRESQDPFYLKAYTQLQESVDHAKQTQAARRYYAIDDQELISLSQQLQKEAGEQRNWIQTTKQQLILLANRLPADSFASAKRKLEQQAMKPLFITPKKLELLFVRGDVNAYKMSNPSLTKEEIEQLYHLTANWLIIETSLQQKERVLALIEEAMNVQTTPALKTILIQKLYAELSAERSYDPEKEPLFLAIEHLRNLRLRPSQVKQICDLTDPSRDEVHEIPMGSGKSDVLLPLIALRMADGKHLVFYAIPEELIDVEAPKLKEYAETFGQKEVRLNWHCQTKDEVETLHTSLQEIREGRGFVAVTIRELHNFYIDSIAHERIYLQDPTQENLERRAAYAAIRKLLADYGLIYFDEVDAQLRCNFEVLKATNNKSILEITECHIMKTFYDILVSHLPIHKRLYFKWNRKKASKATFYMAEKDKDFLVQMLSEELLLSPALKACGMTFTEKDRQAILSFLQAPSETFIPLPSSLDMQTKRSLSYARKQLQEILPEILGSSYQQQYGLPSGAAEEQTLIPIPFKGVNNPQMGSEFACTAESLGYAYQTYQLKGVHWKKLWDFLQTLQAGAKLEMNRTPKAIEATHAYQRYRALVGKTLLLRFPFAKPSAAQTKLLAQEMSQDPLAINRFVFEYVTSEIGEYRERITSNGQTVPKLFCRKKGVSGTVEKDKHTLYDFAAHTDLSIAGRTLLHLARTKQQFLIVQSTKDPKEQLKTLMAQAGHPMPRAILDGAGLFKDIPPLEIAKTLLEISQGSTVESVVYFDVQRKRWSILHRDSQKPMRYRPTQKENLSTRITVYDAQRCTGAHIAQDPKASAIYMLDDKSDLQQTLQGSSRMRALADGQDVFLACTTEFMSAVNTVRKKPPHTPIRMEDAIAYVKHVEVMKQLQNNLKALYQQIDASFVLCCQKILDQLIPFQTENIQLNQACQALSDMMLIHVKDDPYAQFQSTKAMDSAQHVLETYVKSKELLLMTWKAQFPIPADTVEVHMRAFTTQSLRLVDKVVEKQIVPMQLMHKSSSQEGAAIEVAQAQQQKQNQDTNTQTNHTIARTATLSTAQKTFGLPHIPWKILHPADPQFNMCLPEDQALTTNNSGNPIISFRHALSLHSKISPFNPNLLVSLNAACTKESLKPFFGAQKPFLEWALIIQDTQHLEHTQLVLLSRREAEDFEKLLYQNPMPQGEKPSFSIGLLSLRLHAMQYSDPIYRQSAHPLNKENFFSAEDMPLTEFETLIVQAKFAIGEPALYTERELTYLKSWMTTSGPIEEMEKLFIKGFLPGSCKRYERTVLHTFMTKLKQKKQAKPLALNPPSLPVPLPTQPTQIKSEPAVPVEDQTSLPKPIPVNPPSLPISVPIEPTQISNADTPAASISEPQTARSWQAWFCNALHSLLQTLFQYLCCCFVQRPETSLK